MEIYEIKVNRETTGFLSGEFNFLLEDLIFLDPDFLSRRLYILLRKLDILSRRLDIFQEYVLGFLLRFPSKKITL